MFIIFHFISLKLKQLVGKVVTLTSAFPYIILTFQKSLWVNLESMSSPNPDTWEYDGEV